MVLACFNFFLLLFGLLPWFSAATAELHIVVATNNGASSPVYDCLIETGSCTQLFTLPDGSHAMEVDYEDKGREPRGIVVALEDYSVRYCSWSGTCTQVGTCGSVYPQAALLDKDAGNQVSGYFVKCTGMDIKYCKNNVCTTILAGISYTTTAMSIAIERDVDGLTTALIVPLGDGVLRCPLVGGTWDSANCVALASRQSFTSTRGVDTYYDDAGAATGFIVCSDTHQDVLKCPHGATSCQVIATATAACGSAISVEGAGSATEYFAYAQFGADPGLVLLNAADNSISQSFAGTAYSRASGFGAYKVTTSTTTTTPAGVEIRILSIPSPANTAYECVYPTTACSTITSFGVASVATRIDQEEPGALPRGFITTQTGTGNYCTMDGNCASIGSCLTSTELRGIDFDKDANGYMRGFYMRCQDKTILYCVDGSCSQILAGVVSYTLGTLSAERAANGETVALILPDGTNVKRCPVSGSTASAADCEYIGGTVGESRVAKPYYDANRIVKGYIVASPSHGSLYRCWRNVPTCEVIKSGIPSAQVAAGVVENVDGTPLWFMTTVWGANPPMYLVDPSDYTNVMTFTPDVVGSGIHASDVYLVTSTTTTTTLASVHVELMIGVETDVHLCLKTGVCEYLNLGHGAHHMAVDYDKELWQPPRGVLLATTDAHMVYCTLSGTCTQVGTCDVVNKVRGVGFDKDANNNVLGYFMRCSTIKISYCDLAGTCTEMLSGLVSHAEPRLSVERKASGETAALILGDTAQMYRCPVSGATANAADCERIGGYSASAVFWDVTPYYRADGNVGGYLAVDHEAGSFLRCWRNIPACEVLATGLVGRLFSVGVVENTDGSPLWFTTNRFDNTQSGLFIDANDHTTQEDFSSDAADSRVMVLVPYLVQVTSTTTTTTTTTTSSTSTSTTSSTSSTTSTSSTSTTSSTSKTSTTTSTTSSTSTTTSTTTSSSTSSATTSTTSTTTLTTTASTTTTTTSTQSTTLTSTESTTTVTISTTTITGSTTTTTTTTTTTSTKSTSTSATTTLATSTTTTVTTMTTSTASTSTTFSSTKTDTTSATSASVMVTSSSFGDRSTSSMTSTVTGRAETTRGGGAATTMVDTQVSTVYCQNDATFSDRYGLLCSDWSDWDCTVTDDMYDEDDISAVQTACPVSCALCPEGSIIIADTSSSSSSFSSSSSGSTTASSSVSTTSEVIFEESAQVSLDFSMDFDISGTTEEAFLAGVGASVAASVGVAESYVKASLVSQGSRRLAGGVVVRCQIVVPPGSLTLSIVKSATKISEEGSDQSKVFKSSLSTSIGLDTSTLTMASSQVKATTVKIAKKTDGTLVDVSEVSSSTSSENGNVETEAEGAVTLATGCEDEVFVDEQGYDCSSWIGYSCSSSKWLTGEKPYSLVGLLEVQANCILSCGRCSPSDRPTPDELKSTCQDDEYTTNFCRRWRGMNCAAATNYSFSATYTATLQKRCPLSCGTCEDETIPTPCADTANFLDENNYRCQDWVGFSCTKMYSGYTEEGMQLVQAYCRESCNFCTASHAATKQDIEIDKCEDDPNFLIDGSFGCDYFVGKSCQYSDLFLNPRWMLGPAASAEWHQALWKHCPVSCGICSPEDHSSNEDLLLECEDDARLEPWCLSNWEGTGCNDWNSSVQLGSQSPAENFNATVFGRCPKSCGICTPPACQAGTRRNKAEHTCEACPPGEYSSSMRSGREAARCTVARAGFYVNASGSTQETQCDFGMYSSDPGALRCDGCPAGRFTGARGSSKCEACAPGFFTAENGQSVCFRCAFGFYQDESARSACHACPPTFTTINLGSTSSEECVCPAGTYFDLSTNSCLACPRGFECFGGANDVDNTTGLDPTILLMPGVMSLPAAPLSAYTCIGDEMNCPGHRQPGVGADSPNPICQGGSLGVRCGYCLPGAYLDVEEGCVECPNHSGILHVLRIALVLSLLVICLRRSYLATARDDFPPKVMFWLAVAFLQFLTAVQHLPVNWPNILVGVWDFCNIFNIFDFLGNFLNVNEECLFGDSVTILMIRDVIKPLAWPIVLFIPANILHRLATSKNFNWMLVVATIADALIAVFIQVAVMVVYALPIEEMPNGKLFLSYHPRIERGSAEWTTLLPLTALAVLVYFAGFLGFVVYGLWSLPRLVAQESEYRHLFDFFGDYRPSMYWWTGVLLAYEFFFALANAVFDNPYIRIYLTIVLVIAFALLEVAYKPGLTWETQNSAVAGQIGMATILALSTGIQGDETVDMEDHKPTIAALAFTVILLMAIFTVVKLVHEFVRQYQAQEKTVKKNIRLLVECRNFMNQHLACEVKNGCLKGVVDLDHCQAELLVQFGHLSRVGLLGIAPEHRPSTLHTFVDFVLSGNRLAYSRDSRKFVRSSTAAIARKSRAVQMNWSSGREQGESQAGSQPTAPSNDSSNLSNYEESSGQDGSFYCDLSERVDGVPSRPSVTLPFRATQWSSTHEI